MTEVKLSMEEYQNVVKSLNTLIEKLYEMTKKCSDYKRQRDELINDIQNVKRKAEAFDEIEGLVSKTKSAEDLGECVLQLLIENKEVDH
ncbi:hypothetical protein [Staphylococcus hominis]|uniref:hypothetical protein n=1 Tax=Staphylococcus hominis TaxID=1290 RepID=UPI00321B0A2E